MEHRKKYHAPAGKSISEQLRTVRQYRRLSQQTLGDRAGLPQHRVSLLERGVAATAGEIERLAAVLEVTPDALTDPRVAEAVGVALNGGA